MATTVTHSIPAGSVLAVTASADGSGSIVRKADPGSLTQYSPVTVAASETISFGPFTNDRRYSVVSDGVSLTVAVTLACHMI